MAATAFNLQTAPHDGMTVTFPAISQNTGHTAPAGPGNMLLVVNSSGASINVDLHVTATVDGDLPVATPSGAAAPARRFAVGAGATGMIPLPPSPYANNLGLATFDLSAYASVNVACVKSS